MRRNWEEKENHRQSERKKIIRVADRQKKTASRQTEDKQNPDKETEKNRAIDFWE